MAGTRDRRSKTTERERSRLLGNHFRLPHLTQCGLERGFYVSDFALPGPTRVIQGNEGAGHAAGLLCELLPFLQRRASCLASVQTAEDAVQSACEKLLNSSANLVRHPNPRAYALRAVTTAVYDLRRRQTRETSVAELPDMAAEDSPIDLCEADWEAARLLSLLSPGQAAAIRLVDIEGHSIDRAAEILEVHRGTVSRARDRGLRRLRGEIDFGLCHTRATG